MANLRVLLADDDVDLRANAASALTQQGYSVVPAADGSEALGHMQNGSLDVVVAQVDLPRHSGLELLRAALDKPSPVPVILLADARTIGAAANGVRAGAFDYVVKPLDDMTRLAILIDRAAAESPAPRRTAASPGPSAPPPGTTGEARSTALLDSITLAQDLNVILGNFADELARTTRAAHTYVLVPHNDGQLHLSASHGYSNRAEAGRSYAGGVHEKFALRVATTKSVRWLHPNANLGTSNTLGIPLLFQDQVMGIAIAQDAAPAETFSPASMALVQELAQQAAIGIELARLGTRVKRLEPLDPITGLFTREHFFELSDRDFRRAWRFDQTLCAIVMDVDEFSAMHLTLGPQRTDYTMRRIAHVVRENVRRVDLVGRLNPHTLGLVLWMAKKEHGIAVAERLRLLIAEIEVQAEDETWQVTASFGVAHYRSTTSSIFDLFGIANQGLRAAKRAGRNRVEGV